MIRRPLALLVLAGALLGGCVTLLPKAVPASLYKLAIDDAPASLPSGASVVNVLRAPTTFPRMSANDQIVTVTGNEAASIEGARWAAPAEIMFDEAMISAFDASTKVRLETRGAPTVTDHVLRIEVHTFEARYGADPKAAPTANIELTAVLTGPPNPANPTGPPSVREQAFRAEVPATENRVSTIVDAYNTATAKVLGDVVKWTETAVATP